MINNVATRQERNVSEVERKRFACERKQKGRAPEL